MKNNIVETVNNYQSKFNTCVGPSMYPTIKSGDGLILYTYKSIDDISVGDVIIYPHPGKSVDVVHRIIKKCDTGVITRGDNNNKIDPYIIKYENILGKVISAKRENRLIHLLSGRKGYLFHRFLIIKKFTLPVLVVPVSYISRKITKSQLLNFCHCMFDLELVHIKKGENHKYILLHNKKVIGTKSVETDNQWQIKFPYKLFINKNKI